MLFSLIGQFFVPGFVHFGIQKCPVYLYLVSWTAATFRDAKSTRRHNDLKQTIP